MLIIGLDAEKWTTIDDFCVALFAALGSPEWHGESIDALIDSMIWGGINAVEPPYTIKICNVRHLPKDVLEYIELLNLRWPEPAPSLISEWATMSRYNLKSSVTDSVTLSR